MRVRPMAVTFLAVTAVLLGLASPAGAVATRTAATVPACTIASPEKISGAEFENGQFVNGTWTYSTGVACTADIGDIALYEELDFNGVKVNSKSQGFTGVPKDVAVITSTYFCAQCNGTWLFKWGQILEAPAGFTFTTAQAGCVLAYSGLIEECVQTRTVVL